MAKVRKQAQQSGTPNLGALKGILSKIMGGSESNDKLNQGEQMQQQAQGYNFDPNNVCPPEVKQRLVELLRWHDDVMRQILKKIEMVPGLANLLEEFSNALNACKFRFCLYFSIPGLRASLRPRYLHDSGSLRDGKNVHPRSN